MKTDSTTVTSRKRRIILLIMTAVLLVMMVASFLICRYMIQTESHVCYMGIMNVASEKIAKTVSGMEMNAMNVFDEVRKHMETPESVTAALQSKTSLNTDVRGYFAAFEPNYFPQKGQWFEPYVHQPDTKGGFVVRNVGSARHDYTRSDWYIRAKESNKSFWSDPYYYYDGTSISGRYCTFVKPVYDAKGRLACVCGADMTFEWLSKEMQQIDASIRQNSLLNKFRQHFSDLDFYTVVINKDGSCIAYPKGKSVSMKDEAVLRDLSEEQSGITELTVNGVPSTIYYCPIPRVDWSVAVVVPQETTLTAIYLVGLLLLTITLLGIIFVWIALRSVRT